MLTDCPKWSWWDLFLVILALISLMALAAMFKNPIRNSVNALGIGKHYLETFMLLFSTFLQATVMVAAVVFVTRRKGATIRDLGLTGNNIVRNIGTGLIGGLFLGIAIWVLGVILAFIFGPPESQEVERWLVGLKQGKDMILPFIAISILAPVSEEIYFRGMVYPVIRGKFGPVLGMILSGLFFGSLHLDLYRLLPISAGGAVLAYFYEKSESLVTPIIAHSAWNSLMLFTLFMANKHLAVN